MSLRRRLIAECAGEPRRLTGMTALLGFFTKGMPMPDFSQLTERQREIYEFIRDKIETRGYGPTVREIGEAFNIKSPNGVMCHLKALEKKEMIKRDPNHARAIELLGRRRASQGLHLLGRV